MKKLLKEYQIFVGILLSGLMIAATLYLIEFQKQERIRMHNELVLKACLEKRGSLQDKCISDHAIKPYLLKGQYNLD